VRILTFSSEYLPGSLGGTVRAVEGVVFHLGRQHQFHVFARDRRAGATSPYDGVTPGRWQTVGNAAVYYAPPADLAPRRMAEIVRSVDADAYYLNSFLSPAFASLPVMLRWLGAIPHRPTVMAPRGELHPGTLRLKRAKKAMFLQVARRLPAYRDLVWQAGSMVERDHIRRQFTGARVAVARDLTALAGCTPAAPPAPKKRGQLSIAHLSVISPGKNLLAALRIA
jgi:hypothetical protein